jgi:hypothetical protein
MTLLEKRGYVVWLIGGAIFAVPEISASKDSDLPFPTLSGTVGHLERRWEIISLFVILIIVNALMHGVRLAAAIVARRAESQEAKRAGAPTEQFALSGGDLATVPLPLSYGKHIAIEHGRVIRTAEPTYPPNWWWAPSIVITVTAVALGFVIPLWVHGWHASDAEKQLAGEFGYGAMALTFFLIPGLLAYFRAILVPFPGLFQAVLNLEARISIFAVAVAGCMTFLMLHLVLYPYPSLIPWFPNLEHLHNYCVQHGDELICTATKPK